MKKKHIVAILVSAVFFSGCSTVSMKDNLITIDEDYFLDKKQLNTNKSASTQSFSGGVRLQSAYNQVNGIATSASVTKSLSSDDAAPLPDYLVGEPLIKKVINAAYLASGNTDNTSLNVSKDDISSMSKLVSNRFGTKNNIVDESDGDKKKISRIIKQYLIIYYTDSKLGFINREGVVYKRPEIKSSIGNDIITAVIAIVLEGVFDGLLDTPVYVVKGKDKDKDKFQTKKGATPTVYRLTTLTKVEKEPIVARGKDGIDDLELKAIRFLSGLAGDQSKALSGAVFRGFGGLELSFVIGGKFSFGDNDTLAKILDTSFEIASKRIVEEGAHHGFYKITNDYGAKSASNDGSSPAKLLLDDLKDVE